MTDTNHDGIHTTASEDLQRTLASLRAAAKDIVDLGNHRLVAAKDTVVGGTRSAVERGRALIVAYPYVAIGLAFGIGYFAMRLMRR